MGIRFNPSDPSTATSRGLVPTAPGPATPLRPPAAQPAPPIASRRATAPPQAAAGAQDLAARRASLQDLAEKMGSAAQKNMEMFKQSSDKQNELLADIGRSFAKLGR